MYNCRILLHQIDCQKDRDLIWSGIVMLNRATFRIISLTLSLALSSILAFNYADAQDPPRPPEPKQPPPQADAREKKGERRQGAQTDEQTANKDTIFKLDTDLVLLDVTVI